MGSPLQPQKSRRINRGPPGVTERKPALSCTTCSSNLLSCSKSLWGLRFLQRHMGGPSEEPSGEPLSEEPQKRPPQKAVRTLPSEAV